MREEFRNSLGCLRILSLSRFPWESLEKRLLRTGLVAGATPKKFPGYREGFPRLFSIQAGLGAVTSGPRERLGVDLGINPRREPGKGVGSARNSRRGQTGPGWDGMGTGFPGIQGLGAPRRAPLAAGSASAVFREAASEGLRRSV